MLVGYTDRQTGDLEASLSFLKENRLKGEGKRRKSRGKKGMKYIDYRENTKIKKEIVEHEDTSDVYSKTIK